jgi:glycosyltransferase involved in cell wall biosynthesis
MEPDIWNDLMARALFIVDSYTWALANRAANLKQYFSKHDILIKHFRDINDLNFNNFDLVYSLNWPIHTYIREKISARRNYRLVTTISSHVGRNGPLSISSVLNNYDAISTSSNLLFSEFRPAYPKKVYNTPFGVNTENFYSTTEPSKYSNVFGWVGNHKRAVKRFDIINDTFKTLGPDYQLKTAFQSDNLNAKQMLDFYNSIGTLICFSESEGTPNPILEAGACGRSIISTNVGNVIQIKKCGAITSASKKEELKKSIQFHKNNPVLISKYGKLIKEHIYKEWSWKARSKGFQPFLGISYG